MWFILKGLNSFRMYVQDQINISTVKERFLGWHSQAMILSKMYINIFICYYPSGQTNESNIQTLVKLWKDKSVGGKKTQPKSTHLPSHTRACLFSKTTATLACIDKFTADTKCECQLYYNCYINESGFFFIVELSTSVLVCILSYNDVEANLYSPIEEKNISILFLSRKAGELFSW